MITQQQYIVLREDGSGIPPKPIPDVMLFENGDTMLFENGDTMLFET